MKKTNIRRACASLLAAFLLLGGCGAAQDSAAASSGADILDLSGVFSDRDLAGDYDESAAIAIELTGDTAVCSSDAVTVNGSQVVLSEEGVYLLSGALTDGQILIDAADTDKVQLVLAGADITSATSAAIYARAADKVFLTLAEGTENTLANGGSYVATDDNNVDAVIFSKTDLTLNGAGSLTINAQAGHGVVSKDDLVVTGGSYTVSAASHGLSGKDCLAIAGGSFTITSGKDGLHADNSDDTSLGWLYLADGSYAIASQGDAVSASGALQIDGGDFTLSTGDGSESVTMDTGDEGRPMGGRGMGMAPGAEAGGIPPERNSENAPPEMEAGSVPPEMNAENAPPEMDADSASPETTADETADDSVSQKGVKAEGAFAIGGGTFTIDSADDCLHAGGEMRIAAGEFTLRSGDDAVHSDSDLVIQDGTFTIPYCYEGIEGLSITVEGGSFDITSHDDGLNAAGGTDNSCFGGMGGRPQDNFAASEDTFITINGGTFTIVSTGDCVDSNGALTINGGTLDLTCNGAGNTALDCDGTYTNNGGEVSTNDGSEANPGQMGGGQHGGAGERPQGRGERPAREQQDAQTAE